MIDFSLVERLREIPLQQAVDLLVENQLTGSPLDHMRRVAMGDRLKEAIRSGQLPARDLFENKSPPPGWSSPTQFFIKPADLRAWCESQGLMPARENRTAPKPNPYTISLEKCADDLDEYLDHHMIVALWERDFSCRRDEIERVIVQEDPDEPSRSVVIERIIERAVHTGQLKAEIAKRAPGTQSGFSTIVSPIERMQIRAGGFLGSGRNATWVSYAVHRDDFEAWLKTADYWPLQEACLLQKWFDGQPACAPNQAVEPTRTLRKPAKADDWFQAISDMVNEFKAEHGRFPNKAEAWTRLRDNSPTAYGITAGKDKGEDAVFMDGKPLGRDAFGKRWGRYTQKPDNADNADNGQ